MNNSTTTRINRKAKLTWVALGDLQVNPLAQRDLNNTRVEHIAGDLKPELIGNPTVSHRDGVYYVVDGQHRIAALRIGGYAPEAKLQVWVYEGLTSGEEADLFLSLNDALAVRPMAKFKAAVHAGRPDESEIDRVVRAQGLIITADRLPGAIAAVATVQKVYSRSGPKTLGRTLRIIRDSYGDAGLEAPVIDGIGLLCAHYNGELDDVRAVKQLQTLNGGVYGLLNQAQRIRLKTGNARSQCVAAACVDAINRGKGGKKLPAWFKEDDEVAA